MVFMHAVWHCARQRRYPDLAVKLSIILSPSPWSHDGVNRNGSDAFPRHRQQLSLGQPGDCALNRPLRQPGLFGNVLQSHPSRGGFVPMRLAPQEQVDQVRGRLSIVADQIDHQRVEDVLVDL